MLLAVACGVIAVLIGVAVFQASTSESDAPQDDPADRSWFCSAMSAIDIDAVVSLTAADVAGSEGDVFPLTSAFVRGTPASSRVVAEEVVETMRGLHDLEDGFDPTTRQRLRAQFEQLAISADEGCAELP